MASRPPRKALEPRRLPPTPASAPAGELTAAPAETTTAAAHPSAPASKTAAASKLRTTPAGAAEARAPACVDVSRAVAGGGASPDARRGATEMPADNAIRRSADTGRRRGLSVRNGARRTIAGAMRVAITNAAAAAAPTIPSLAAAPTKAIAPFLVAPIPSGTLPTFVVPAVVFIVVDELDAFDAREHRRRQRDADGGFRPSDGRQGYPHGDDQREGGKARHGQLS